MPRSDFLKLGDHARAYTVDVAYRNLGKLFAERVLNYPLHPLYEAVITYFLINLSDLLEFAGDLGFPVTFADDVQTTAHISNVTDLIKHCRNAACHLATGRNSIGGGHAAFNVIAGDKHILTVNGVDLHGEYVDDAAIFFGATRLYQGRHLLRALKIATADMIRLCPEREAEWKELIGWDLMPASSAP